MIWEKFMEVKQTDKLQYPVVTNKKGQNKSFVQKMQDVMQYQIDNSNETQKSAFYNQDASNEKIKDLTLINQLFKSCKFYTTTFVASVFTDCTFIDCDFTAVKLFNVKFENCSFRNCNFTDAQMQDVNAETSTKTNCILNDIDLTKNVKGFSTDDTKIIQDSVVEKSKQSTNSSVYENVKTALSDWNEVETQCFQLSGQDDENCGLAIYPNSEKNTQENTDIWEFVFFYGNESLLMTEYNLFNLTSQEIVEKVEQWKQNILINQSSTIMQNLLKILQD